MAEKFWKLGIIGWPLGYSLSPAMHKAALKACGLQGEYREYPVEPDDLNSHKFDRVLAWLDDAVSQKGLDGFNVTMPYKALGLSWIMSRNTAQTSNVLMLMDAINTVAVRDGIPSGFNTDGEGFLHPLSDRALELSGWHAVLLGGGGAARAIAVTLGQGNEAERIEIWSRRLEQAERVANKANMARTGNANTPHFAKAVNDLRSLPVRDCQMLINATPLGMEGEGDVPLEILDQLHKGQVVYDIVYEPRETKLVSEARERGCEVITGDEMLAGQGAAAFEIWTGVPAAKVLPAMKRALDEHFAGRS